MGYSTDFTGKITIEPALNPVQKAYINAFNDTRRMGRDPKVLMAYHHGDEGRLVSNKFPDEVEQLSHLINELGYHVKLTKMIVDWKTLDPAEVYGVNGEYYVGDNEKLGVYDYNCAPGQKEIFGKVNKDGQPGLWCKWCINEDGELEWDGNEKFYDYVEWLQYLINHFFNEWGVLLNGEILWEGEDSNDRGKIVVTNSVVETYEMDEIKYKKRK